MHTTTLRKVGGSVMLAIPPVLLDLLQLKADEAVALDVEDGRLVVDPRPRVRYSLKELLAESDYAQARTAKEQEWLEGTAAGRELL